jgi:hypothetical protein
MVKIAKILKSSSLLAPFLFSLSFDVVKEHLPLILLQIKDDIEIGPLFEKIETVYGEDQDKVAELLYLVLKLKFEP